MEILSGIKTVSEVFKKEETKLYDVSGGRNIPIPLEDNRIYIIPGYQREIRWDNEKVQILVDDLKKGSKFLGTIILSTSEACKFEIIDGQQRLTVITLMITYLNSILPPNKKIEPLCKLHNASFEYFDDALIEGFDYEAISKTNKGLYEHIIQTDVLEQKEDFRRIWLCLKERIDKLSVCDQEKLLTSLSDSSLNIILNKIGKTKAERKFCIDYFIDINNKSVDLESLDFIRAYAFKEDFDLMSSQWIEIQNKCSRIRGKVKYSREELYYQYFICRVNKELDYQLKSSLGQKYITKEEVRLKGKVYSKGTSVWYMFSNDKFYSGMLKDLNDYLDFILLILKAGNGTDEEFKKYFRKEDGTLIDSDTISNAFTIISNILLNDDVVPKMMILKLYLEILKPERMKSKQYKIVYDIFAIANIFSINGNKKSSEPVANKLLPKDWETEIKNYGYKLLHEIYDTTDFAKVCKLGGSYTIESGQYMARRYYSMMDSFSWKSGNTSINEKVFLSSNARNGKCNDEHFIINRKYEYALYKEDGNTVDVSVKLPNICRKYIATLANYIVLESSINSKLKNRPVYEKIEMIESVIKEKDITQVIPSRRSQLHYFLIKKILHDQSKYPDEGIKESKSKKEKKDALKNYYNQYFEDEFLDLANMLKREDLLIKTAIEYDLKKMGFTEEEGVWRDEQDNEFSNFEVKIGEKTKKIFVSIELYNPASGESDGDKIYSQIIEFVCQRFKQILKKEPCLISSKEWGCDYEESFTFEFEFDAEIKYVENFIEAINQISDDLLNGSFM